MLVIKIIKLFVNLTITKLLKKKKCQSIGELLEKTVTFVLKLKNKI